MRLLLIINTALLFSADIFLAVQSVFNGTALKDGKKVKWTDAGYDVRRLRRAARLHYNPSSAGMSLVERIELAFIDKSNIRHYLPFMNFYTLAATVIIVFFAVLRPVYGVLRFLPSAVVISLLFAMLPLFALDLLARYNSEIIRRRLAEFISVLNRWCSVKEDIFFAFEKSVESGIGEPLKTFVRDTVIQVNRGMEPAEALDMLQLKVDNLQFRDFIINIKQNIRFRGNIIKLLTSLENQFYKIEEEYNRRRISTYKDRMLLYFIMFAVIAIAFFFIRSSAQIEYFYLSTNRGKALLALFSLLYAAGAYLSFGITRFRH